ncbi:MAG TPA: Pr6Pr family membrane protein [Candidatus Saccharibacteria bacterium]|nr:Pr6Pr family membrane protein [Candidatus Saccharibacteria bacterium]
MKNKYPRILRTFFGLLGLSSVLIEIIVLTNEGVFNAANFFSFFTILSNIIAGVYLIYFGVTNNHSQRSQVIRGGVTLYMLMTGVIFAILLAGLENVRLTAVPWDNLVLHYVMPFVLVIDWLMSPPKEEITQKESLTWIVVPVAYVVYTLMRGSLVDWYPYPFLNPTLSSYGQVIGISVIIAIFVVGSAAMLARVPLWRYPKS